MVFLLLFWVNSALVQLLVTTDSVPVLVKLQTTPCRGYCPDQTLTVFADGRAVYEGRQHTGRLGIYRRWLTKTELKTLKARFRAARFFEFKDSYQTNVTDLPTTYLTFADGPRRKTILDYAGTPDAVKTLENQVLDLLKKRGWKKTAATAPPLD